MDCDPILGRRNKEVYRWMCESGWGNDIWSESHRWLIALQVKEHLKWEKINERTEGNGIIWIIKGKPGLPICNFLQLSRLELNDTDRSE